MATLYPWGYGHGMGTIDQIMAELNQKGHPEFVRRIRPWLVAQGGHVGIGGGWRSTQPTKPGFAPDGKSFHQTQKFASGLLKFCAVDLVVDVVGGAHRAPYWKEVPKEGTALARTWGLHCNVTGEPWHMQPIEIDGWTTWVNAGRKDPVKGYRIPGNPPTTTPGLIKDEPPPTLQVGVVNPNNVRWLQQILNERFGTTLTVNGVFGATTKTGVIKMQGILDREITDIGTADGVYGPRTSAALGTWLDRH